MVYPVTGREPLRVGVVGLGLAGQIHLDSYSAIPGVEVVAVADNNPDLLRQVGESTGIPCRCSSWEDLVALDGLDAVSVSAPTFLHAPVALAALEAGRHVLCEKPLARTAGEAETMVAAAVRADRVLQTVFNYRRREDVQTLKRHMDLGGLGRVYHSRASWLRRRSTPSLNSWFTSRVLSGGGPLIDLGVHLLDTVLYLLGEPGIVSVTAATHAQLGHSDRSRSGETARQHAIAPYDVEDTAVAFLRLADGSTLMLETSWAGYVGTGDDMGIVLFGTSGGARIDVHDYAGEDTLRIYADVAGAEAEIRPRVNGGDGHTGVIRSFIETIRSGSWNGQHGEESLRRARIIDACYSSAAQQREVVLEGG